MLATLLLSAHAAVEVTVCKQQPPITQILQHQVNYRLADAAKMYQGLKVKRECVPITCKEYAGCPGSCADIPKCMPLVEDEIAVSTDEDEFVVGYKRLWGDTNVALIPNPRVYPAKCNLPAVKTAALTMPWEERHAYGIYRGPEPTKTREELVNMRPITSHTRGLLASRALAADMKQAAMNDKEGYKFLNHTDDASANNNPDVATLLQHRCIVHFEKDGDEDFFTWAMGSGSLIIAPAFLTMESSVKMEPWVNYLPFEANFTDHEGVTETSRLDNVIATHCRFLIGELAPGQPEWPPEKTAKMKHTTTLIDGNQNLEYDYTRRATTPSEISKSVPQMLENARQHAADMCDQKREANRMYLMLSQLGKSVLKDHM